MSCSYSSLGRTVLYLRGSISEALKCWRLRASYNIATFRTQCSTGKPPRIIWKKLFQGIHCNTTGEVKLQIHRKLLITEDWRPLILPSEDITIVFRYPAAQKKKIVFQYDNAPFTDKNEQYHIIHSFNGISFLNDEQFSFFHLIWSRETLNTALWSKINA